MTAGVPKPGAWLLVLGLPVVLAWLITQSPLHARLEAWLLDSGQAWLAPVHHDPDTVVVTLDNESLAELAPYLGPWPYDRGVYALLLDYLGEQGATTVFLDLLFLDPRAGDATLREALARNPQALLAASGLRNPPSQPAAFPLARLAWGSPGLPLLPALPWPAAALPDPVLDPARPAPRVGLVSFNYDSDGLLRRLPLLHRVAGHYLPSAILSALYRDASPSPPPLAWDGARLRVGERQWPVDDDGTLGIVYPANPDPFDELPFAELVLAMLGHPEHVMDEGRFRDKTVFIGTTALFSDNVNTPLGVQHGVKVLATAYSTFRAGIHLARPSRGWALLLVAMALLVPLYSLGGCHLARHPPRPARLLIVGLLLLPVLHGVYFALLALRQPTWIVPALVALLSGGVLAAAHAQRLLAASARAEAQAAEARAEAASQAVAMVSHELKSPLAIIDMSLQNLRRLDDLPATAVERHRKIERASRRLLSLVNDLLARDRLQHADPSGMPGVVDGLALLADVLAAVDSPRLNLCKPAVSDLSLWGDAALLRVVFANLVDNALKYSPAEAPVSVTVSRDGSEARIEVSDQGMGIAAADLPRLFDPYFRTGDAVGAGHGLGLAVVRRIVEGHGGTVTVDSVPGRGSRFLVSLPLAGVAAPPRVEERRGPP